MAARKMPKSKVTMADRKYHNHSKLWQPENAMITEYRPSYGSQEMPQSQTKLYGSHEMSQRVKTKLHRPGNATITEQKPSYGSTEKEMPQSQTKVWHPGNAITDQAMAVRKCHHHKPNYGSQKCHNYKPSYGSQEMPQS